MEATKQTQSLTDLSRRGAVIEFFSAYQEMEIDRMLNLCTDEGEVHFLPLGESGKGKIKVFGKSLWLALMDSFPDLDNIVTSTQIQGVDSVKANVRIFGTQAKDFAGIPSKGLQFGSDHIFIFHFNDENKIDNIRINWDHQSFTKQLGS